MKKLLLSFTILTFVLAFSIQAEGKKQADKSEDKAKVECKTAEKTKTCAVKNRKEYKGFDGKIQKYEKMLSRLKEIREIAVKENATQTTKALDELIAKRQKHFDLMKEKWSKWKSCPPDCVKPCCAAGAKTDYLEQTWAKLQAEVAAGNMTAEDARAKMIDIKKKCAAKKAAGTCPKLKDSKACPVGCTMPCCAVKKE